MVILAPTASAIKEVHDTFIKQYGCSGYMCEGMVEGCLERAMTYVYDFKPFPKLFLKAGAIMYSFISFHPFVDANKRTAFETTRLFLRLNGYELRANADEGFAFTKAIADFKITDVNEIAQWIKQHSRRNLSNAITCYMLKFVLNQYNKQLKLQPSSKIPNSMFVIANAVEIYPE